MRILDRPLNAICIFCNKHANLIAWKLVHLPFNGDLGPSKSNHVFRNINNLIARSWRTVVSNLALCVTPVFCFIEMPKNDRQPMLFGETCECSQNWRSALQGPNTVIFEVFSAMKYFFRMENEIAPVGFG